MSSPNEYPIEDLEAMSESENYMQWIHSFFKPYLDGDIAEVGAGTGVYSKILVDLPSINQLTVFEPSPNLIKKLTAVTKRGSDQIKCFNSIFQIDSEKYDAIVYVNVMEHIKDDFEEMKKVHKSLKKQGKLLIFVPALPILYSKHDKKVGHYRRYTKKDLFNKVEQAGFKIIRQRYFDSLGVLSWLIYCKWMKLDPEKGSVSIYDNVFVPVLRIVENIIPPVIGKNIILIAEKK